MKLSNKTFHSKILLLGEYAVLHNNDALGVPYSKYSGHLCQVDSFAGNINGYYDFLLDKQFSFLNPDLISSLSNRNIGYDSNIPIGYGLGSSAALTAALYDHCKVASDNITDLASLQIQFAKMESYFHGKSSGFDPLVSYLNAPIHKTKGGEIVKISSLEFNGYNVFLYDSENKRNTKGFVDSFINNSEGNETYKPFYKANNEAIHSIVNHKTDTLSFIKAISQFQLTEMKQMIPDYLLDVWSTGLSNDTYYMKLCGAGGGGYFLVFAKSDITPELKKVSKIN